MFDKFKYKKSEFEELSFDDEKVIWGKLKMLEELAALIDAMRESLTRHLVVNGAGDCENEDDLKKRWDEKKEESTEVEKETKIVNPN